MTIKLTAVQCKLFLLFLALFLMLMAQAEASTRQPSEKRECALCHIMWLTDFKREDITPLIPFDPKPIEPSGQQDIVSTERMCLSCHDGFVLDSRFLWKGKKHQHPVGQVPSDKIVIPQVEGKNILPLNFDGKVYCGTCHTAHGVDWSTEDSPVFMRIRTRDGALCQICHRQQIKGARHGTHPLGKDIDHDLPYFKNTRAETNTFGRITCQSCHTPHAAGDEKLLITENKNSSFCGNCHVKRHALTREEAAAKHTHPVNIVPKDAKVAEVLIENGGKLGDNGEVICETCHSPHEAKTNNSLLLASNEKSKLCHACHEKQQTLTNSRHDIQLINKSLKNIRKQTVEEGGDCSACHVPHEGEGPKMWARKISPDIEPMAALCLSCHTENGIAKKHQVGEFTHPVGVDIALLGQPVTLPSYTKDGVKLINNSKGFVTCASCHDPHQWDPKNANKENDPEEEGNAVTSFLRETNDKDSNLCRTCHKKQEAIVGSKHDLNKMAPDSVNAKGLTPPQAGTCGSCHAVHNGLGPRMWARKNLPNSPVNAANCLSCHNDAGIAKDKPIDTLHSHPINVSVKSLGITATTQSWVSRFLPLSGLESLTSLPLYNKEGHAYEGGTLVGCATCHDPHNWSVEQQDIDVDEEGNSTNSFLRIAEKGNADLCINCHNDKAVVKFSKHALRGAGTDIFDEENPSGSCRTCHRPHQTKGPYLWAEESGQGETPIQKLCNSCHNKDGSAKGKLTGKHSHPIGIELTANMKPDAGLPMFTKAGKRIQDHKGNLDCATCHNPHQWDPRDASSQAGKDSDVEGDANNSFLRISAAQNAELCLNCHNEKKTVLCTEHDLAITRPNARNKQEQTVSESGVCGQCHTPHNAISDLRLWAQMTSPGSDLNEELCLSCHNENHVANNKVPDAYYHPSHIQVWNQSVRVKSRSAIGTGLPVFGADGRPAQTGIISCPTCHNVHQWWADADRSPPGKDTEGDTKSSFLRLSQTDFFVCADCHGADSLFRYKYFHAPKTHKEQGFTSR